MNGGGLSIKKGNEPIALFNRMAKPRNYSALFRDVRQTSLSLFVEFSYLLKQIHLRQTGKHIVQCLHSDEIFYISKVKNRDTSPLFTRNKTVFPLAS